MAAPFVRIPVEVPKSFGDWSVADVRSWMVIKWPSLLGLNTNITLPLWVKTALETLFPPDTVEGVAIELIQTTVDYGLNEIPTASVQVAVGRLAKDVRIPAAIHFLVKRLKLFLAASIYTRVEVRSAKGRFDPWPVNADGSAKPFRIFDGYIVGTGFRKTSQGVEFHCSLTNWLSDLNFSSALSRSSSPQNPAQISFDPVVPIFPNAGARSPGLFRQGTPLTQPMAIINSDTLQADLWGKTNALPTDPLRIVGAAAAGVGGIKQWFTEICKNDRINWRQIQFAAGACGSAPPQPVYAKNVEALAALSRIEPLSTGYVDGAPLKMDRRPGIQNIAAQIATQIGLETATVHNGTIWDKLVGQFAVALQFAIVPQVEKALVVPFCPGLRKAWATIFANDYDYYERSDFIPRPIRGVGLFVGREFGTGGHMSLNNHAIYDTVGAYYENPNRRNGMVIWKEAPKWLATIPLPHMYIVASKGRTVANALDSRKGDVPIDVTPKCKIERSKSLWCDYAQGMYIQEILRGRSGRLSGRLRFDIAPGSIIKIEEPEEPFVLEALGETRSYIYAQVLRVSCVLNSEAKKAGTAIQFGFARDEEENQDPSYSLERHPLWANNWYGAPLVNDAAFYPGGPPGVSPPENKDVVIPDVPCT